MFPSLGMGFKVSIKMLSIRYWEYFSGQLQQHAGSALLKVRWKLPPCMRRTATFQNILNVFIKPTMVSSKGRNKRAEDHPHNALE